MVLPDQPSSFEIHKAPAEIRQTYFSPESNELVARQIIEPSMLLEANQKVAMTYKKHGYLTDQKILTVPKDIDPVDLMDRRYSESLAMTLIQAQHGPEGVAEYLHGHVFIAQRPTESEGQSGELLGLIDVYIPKQRTYIVTGNGEILYSVRTIPKTAERKLPIQQLTLIGDALQQKGIDRRTADNEGTPALFIPEMLDKELLSRLLPGAKYEEVNALLTEASPRATINALQVELSQLAVCTDDLRIPDAFEKLFAALFADEEKHGIRQFGAVLDFGALILENALRKVDSEERPRFGIIPLAEKTRYMGSPVVPVLIDRDYSIQTVAKTHPRLAEILEGLLPDKIRESIKRLTTVVETV